MRGIGNVFSTISFLKVSLALVPLAIGPWFLGVSLLKVVVAALAGVWGAAVLLIGKKTWRPRSRLDAPLAAFAVFAVVSAMTSVDSDLSFFGDRQELVFSLQGLAGCLVAFYLGSAEIDEDRMGLAAWAVGGSVPVSLLAIFEAMQGQTLRVNSTMGNPVFLGAYLAMIAPLSVFVTLNPREFPVVRAIGAAASICLMAALALTGSRGAWIAGAAAVMVAAAPHWKKNINRYSWPAIFIAAVGLIVFSVLGRHARALTSSMSDNVRMGIWRCALRSWEERPWFGSGIGTFVIDYARFKSPLLAKLASHDGYARVAHSDVLEVLATMGLAGLAIAAWIYAALVRAFLAAKRLDPVVSSALGAALIAVVLVAKFNPMSFAVVWIASALAGSLCSERGDQSSRRRLPVASIVFWTALGWFSTAVCWRAVADHYDVLGRQERAEGRPRRAAEYFESALRVRPGVIAYANDMTNLLWDVAAVSEDLQRRLLLDRATSVVVEALRHRPLDPQLHRLLALAEIKRAQSGDESRLSYAARAVAAAEELDPGFDDKDGLREAIRLASRRH